MKSTDRFLIVVVAAVIVLVLVVLALALLRPNQPAYQPDDTPQGVAHNYLLALQLEEYDRAYGYLSHTLPGFPDSLDAFERDIEDHRWSFDLDSDGVSLAIESVDVSGDKANIVVRRTQFYRGGLFDSGQRSSTFDMTLRRGTGVWKVTESDSYWASCWESSQACP